jgi:hypothetical protein
VLTMGGRGCVLCVNICVPSSALEKPIIVLTSKQLLRLVDEQE